MEEKKIQQKIHGALWLFKQEHFVLLVNLISPLVAFYASYLFDVFTGRLPGHDEPIDLKTKIICSIIVVLLPICLGFWYRFFRKHREYAVPKSCLYLVWIVMAGGIGGSIAVGRIVYYKEEIELLGSWWKFSFGLVGACWLSFFTYVCYLGYKIYRAGKQ